MTTPTAAPVTTTPAVPKKDPVTSFLSRFSWRDIAHFLAPFAATVAVLASSPNWPVGAKAVVPGLAAVLFRQIFPNKTVTPSQVGSAVAVVQAVLGKVPVPTVVKTIVNDAAPVVEQAAAATAVPPSAPPAH